MLESDKIIIAQSEKESQDPLNPLIDKSKSGRIRPWQDKKIKSLKIAKALELIGETGRAVRCQDCGSQLKFLQCQTDGYKKLTHAIFCKDRLCPMCSWRRSLRLMYEISLVLHKASELYPTHRFIFLTLTQKNIFDFALRREIGEILTGWNLLTKQKEFKKSIAGFFRTLEITYNEQNNKWHPHLHSLLIVSPSYFGQSYIKHEGWRKMWQSVMNLDYEPEVRIEAVKNKSGIAEEVGKYLTKDSDMIGDNELETADRVRVLNNALKGKRLVGYGGILRKIAAEVLKRQEKEDLINISDDTKHDEATCPICQGKLLAVVYSWFMKRNNYFVNRKFTLSALAEMINEGKNES